MCWSIKKMEYDENSEKYHKVADKDITVYKIGYDSGNEFYPAFQTRCGYEPNVLKEGIKLAFEVNSFDIDTWYEISKGYHSYSEDCSIVSFETRGVFMLSFYVFTKCNAKIGIGQYVDVTTIAKFIIPKGTEYYENEEGEIVSSQIMWTGQYVQHNTIQQWENIAFKELCVGR